MMPTVTLISHTPNPEKTIAAAAKLCYSSASLDSLMDNLSDEKAVEFVEMLAGLGHESPVEHVSFTFGLEGVSRSLLAQITRHRIASYSVQSQRYVHEKQFAYVLPPHIAQDEESSRIYNQTMQMIQESYDKLSEMLQNKHKIALLEQGVSEKMAVRQAEKQANEDARFVLPNACTTKMIVTMNARSLLNFFTHRCCFRAQWEIREVADQMLGLVYAVAPTLFSQAGPSCCARGCKEGKMSCQKPKEMGAHIRVLKEAAR